MKLRYYIMPLFCCSVFSLTAIAQLSEHTIDAEQMPNEPTVAIANDSVLYAAANVHNFYSIQQRVDGYKSTYEMNVNKQLAKSAYGVYGDPVLHYAADTLFFAHLAKAEGKVYGDWFDRIVLQKITNPTTWQEKSYSVGYNEGKMQDKPWLSATSEGDVLVTWTEFDAYGSDAPEDRSRIRFAKYESDKNAVSNAITISDTTGDCLDGDNTLEGATTAVGRGQKIFAVWSGYSNIYFDYSNDGGATWHIDRVIARQYEGWDMAMPNIMRANGMPFIVADTTRGRLFVTWADERNGNADVWAISSDDEGATWSKPLQLNLDKTTTHQYFPNIGLDAKTGAAYVAYYDFKSSPSNTFYSISLAKIDTQLRVQNYQITPYVNSLPGNSIFFGDYLDIDIRDSLLAVVYTTYDLNQRTKVKVVQEHTLQDGIFFGIAVSNTLAILRNKETTELMINIEHPYKLRYTLKWLKEDTGEVFKYRSRQKDKQEKRGVDEVLATLDFGTGDRLLEFKYRFKDLETNGKYRRTIHYSADSK